MVFTMMAETEARDQKDVEQKVENNHPEPAAAEDEERNTAEETDSLERKCDNQRSPSNATSVFQNFTVFRDFFLAAFSDGYNATFCGVDDVANCCKGAKVAPTDGSPNKTKGMGSSFDASSVQQSASQQDAKRRRKKPLAVAVGFNYTKDYNGRPIIVTPTGSRNSPIDLTNVTSARNSPPRGAPSVPNFPTLNAQPSQMTSLAPNIPALRSRPQSGYPQDGIWHH